MTYVITDTAKMPFGKHKGVPMIKVPAHYLLWIADQDWFKEKFAEYSTYIEENRESLEEEHAEKSKKKDD